MNKQYRAEIRALKKARAKILRDEARLERELEAANRKAIFYCKKERAALRREMDRSRRRVEKSSSKINKRIAILEGRLS